jgi:hypothetical protein
MTIILPGNEKWLKSFPRSEKTQQRVNIGARQFLKCFFKK